MTIFKGGWHTMAALLLSGGNQFRCKDVSAMEASVTLPFQECIYRARNYAYDRGYYSKIYPDWESELDYAALAKWWYECLVSGPLIDVEGYVWVRFGMNPSGQLNTLSDNIFALRLVFSYHLAKQCVNVEQLDSLRKSLIVKMMGDDSIFPDNSNWCGLDNSASEIGFTITDEIEGCVPLSKAKFCGFSWMFNEEYHQYQFKSDYDKVLSSIFAFRKKNSWRFTLAKLYAAKILCYGSQHYRTINMLISYIMTHHESSLYAESQFDSELPMQALLAQNKSEDEISALIFNPESHHFSQL